MFRGNRSGWMGLFALLLSPALFRLVQIKSVNVPVNTLLIRVSLFLVAALPISALVLSLFGLRFDESGVLSLVVLLLSLLACVFMVLTGVIVWLF
jgi:hypothetical protein